MTEPAADKPAPWPPTQQQVDDLPDAHQDAAVPVPPPRRSRRRTPRRKDAWTLLLLTGAATALAVVLGWFLLQGQQGGKLPAAVASGEGAASAGSGSSGGRALSTPQLQRSIERAQQQTQASPADPAAWAMLAHSQAMLGDFAAAKASYAKLAELLPRDAQVLADYADAAGVVQGRRLAGEPAALIGRALALDPKNLKALALAGREAFERKAYGEALGLWERAHAATTDPGLRHELEANMAEARAFDGRDRPPQDQARRPGGTTISGRVELAAALKAQVQPDDTVFIYARPTKGSRMPVALLRKKVSELPLDFTLDDSQAMVPDIKLSMLAQVAVGARVSRRGDATPRPGDLQGLKEPVPLGTQGLRLEISEVLK